MTTVPAPRLFPSIFVVLLFVPVPVVAAFPGLVPGLSQSFHGYPIGVVAGVALAATFIVLTWIYASLSSAPSSANEEQI